MNLPQSIASAIKTAMFNEWQRLEGTASPEFLMPSLFGAAVDKLIDQGYSLVPPDEDKAKPPVVSLAKLKGHHAQLVHSIKQSVDNETRLSQDHAQAIAALLGEVMLLVKHEAVISQATLADFIKSEEAPAGIITYGGLIVEGIAAGDIEPGQLVELERTPEGYRVVGVK